jgi:flagellin-like protein
MQLKVRMKGISPLIATVLLISVTIAIAGIVWQWSGGFFQDQTERVSEQSDRTILCSYGSINVKDLRFQTTQSRLSGNIENTGQIAIGNVSISIVYQNSTSQTIKLCTDPTGSVSCTGGNLSLDIAERVGFNVSIWGSNYDSIRIGTNCTQVTDTADRGDIST